ncbi:MAG TPA: hypothetical protein VNN62_04570 [Methylomirabilota bacterium]|jgi:acyl-homoserine lactone acylase PvdQ|nr:hypothetical protein [Methylomirabilota bacterium]
MSIGAPRRAAPPLPRDLAQDLKFYHPTGEHLVNAFVDGVNGYIVYTEHHPAMGGVCPLRFVCSA